MNPHRHDIRCENCGKLFDLMQAEVGWRKQLNTFTDLDAVGEAWAKCTHCGFVTEDYRNRNPEEQI